MKPAGCEDMRAMRVPGFSVSFIMLSVSHRAGRRQLLWPSVQLMWEAREPLAATPKHP